MNVFDCMIWVVVLLLLTAPVQAQSPQTQQRAAPQTQVEEIYVVRSVPESRISPTEFCASARTGLVDTVLEARFSIRSISISASDGRVLDTNVKPIGSVHACFGPTASGIVKAYLEARIVSKTLIAVGECRQVKSDFPERGINEAHCSADLSSPDDQYVGGLLTTNSITSLKDVGIGTDPPGYTQASVATIRVWKKRLAPAVSVRAEDNPSFGTWKLNLEKSKFDPGPAVRSRIVRIEATGDAVRMSVDQVDADGSHATVAETPKLDGKDYPRTGTGSVGPKFADTIALRRIDKYTDEETLKKAGKVVAVIRHVISTDGKTRTAAQIMGTNARGQAVHDVIVFDKQ